MAFLFVSFSHKVDLEALTHGATFTERRLFRGVLYVVQFGVYAVIKQ